MVSTLLQKQKTSVLTRSASPGPQNAVEDFFQNLPSKKLMGLISSERTWISPSGLRASCNPLFREVWLVSNPDIAHAQKA